MANPAPTINQINAFNATQGTTIDFNIIGGTELVRSNRIYIYDLSDNSLICTHLYVSTESIHELPANTDSSIVYESGKSSADFVNGAQYYAQIQTFTDIAGTEGGSGLSVAKMFWCLVDPTLTITTIPSTISTTSYNVSATYNANTSVVSNIIQQYQFSLYSATGSLLQSSGVIVGSGTQQGTSTAYDISYNFTGLSVGSSYYVVVDVTTTQGMSVSVQSNTFTVSIDTPTLGEATVVNNACDGYISVTSNLSSEYGGSGSGEIVSFETDSENVFTKLQVTFSPTQTGSGTASPDNVRPIYGVGGVEVDRVGKNLLDADSITWTNGLRDDDGNIVASSSHFTNAIVGIKPNTQYTISGTLMSTGSYRIYFLTKNEEWIERTATRTVVPLTFETPNNCGAIQIQVTTTITNLDDVQLEEGTTATEYEPYQGQTISQEFDVSLTPTSKDTDPYLLKAVGDIYGDRLEEELVGGSVAWNQLVQNGDFSYNGYWNARKGSLSISDGIATVTATEAVAQVGLTANSTIYGGIRANHKYLISADVKPQTDNVLEMSIGGGANKNVSITANVWTKAACVWTYSTDYSGGYVYLLLKNAISIGETVQFKNVNCIDLTQLFGSTIADYIYTLEQGQAGAGVAFFRKYFPKPYYPYDAGTIKSVEGVSAHKTVGFNAWDEVMEDGTLNWDTGANVSTSSALRSRNYIQCVSDTNYYFKFPNLPSSEFRVCFYDANKNYAGRTSWQKDPFIYKTPANCAYMRFVILKEHYGSTYQNNICINLSWDGERDGEYEPYVEHSYPLDDSLTLRGFPQVANGKLYYDGDKYYSSGPVDRIYGEYTFTGNEAISNGYTRQNGDYYFTISGVPNIKYSATGTDVCKIVSSTFGANEISADDMYTSNTLYGFYIGNADGKIRACIKDVTTAEQATAWLTTNKPTIVYELATPTTETAEPFENIQKVTPNYGTEEFVTTSIVPVGNNTQYYTRDIFGGYIDLVSGVLTVDRVYASLDGATQYSQTGDYTLYRKRNNPFSTNVSGGNALSNITNNFGNISIGLQDTKIQFPTGGTGYIYASIPNGFDISTVTAVYTLATPQTYQLTPQQIQTLVGVNNVWSEQGDIELSYHIPITNLLVKRQDVDDVSGNWLTLYSQPVEQASDMDFTFIDFLNQYGKTYKYALVPLLTQTQSGVEVEVEGGYTVSDEVQSVFDGVFIADSTGSQKCKANVGYGNVDMNQTVGTITPIGAKYPVVITNSQNQYHNGSISGTIVPDDYYFNGNLSRIDMVNKRDELEQFLTNKRAKIIKDWNGKIWLVMIMDNVSCTFNNNYGMGIVNFSTNWIEVGDPTNQEDLQATGLINIGGV